MLVILFRRVPRIGPIRPYDQVTRVNSQMTRRTAAGDLADHHPVQILGTFNSLRSCGSSGRSSMPSALATSASIAWFGSSPRLLAIAGVTFCLATPSQRHVTWCAFCIDADHLAVKIEIG